MNVEAIRAVLRRFKKDQIPVLLERWTFADAFRNIDISGSKQRAVQVLAAACLEHGMEEEDLSEADVIYRQLHVNSRRWTALRILKKHSSSCDEAQLSIPEVLEDKLSSCLVQFYNNSICAVRLRDSMWLRVAILEGVPSVYYLIYHPHSSLLLTSNIKRAHQKFIFHSFLQVVAGHKLKELSLKGKSAQSLADLVLRRRSQGNFSAFRFNQKDCNPLVRRKRRKQPVRVSHPHIVREDEEKAKRRSTYVKKTFGDNKQPILEKVEFQVEARFVSNKHTGYHGPFPCHVRFEGSSVLDGIRALVEDRAAEPPLPAHLAELHTSSRSYFLIEEKRQTQDEA